MFSVPPLTRRHALFLDFDGTLADIAVQPHAVRLEPAVLRDLHALDRCLDGALALVTGRTLADIEHHLHPWQPPLACEHGAYWRLPGGDLVAGAPALHLEPVLAAAQDLVERHPGLLLERKATGVALHYRLAPQLQQLCRDTLEQALRALPGAELMAGKCVFEVKPAGSSKGRAIDRFLEHAPFAGRVPLFLGDDVTDEAGFAAVQAAGGLGVKVGPGPSVARARLESPAAVRAWLHQAARALSGPAAPTPPHTAATSSLP